jgi:hypothetical protein
MREWSSTHSYMTRTSGNQCVREPHAVEQGLHLSVVLLGPIVIDLDRPTMTRAKGCGRTSTHEAAGTHTYSTGRHSTQMGRSPNGRMMWCWRPYHGAVLRALLPVKVPASGTHRSQVQEDIDGPQGCSKGVADVGAPCTEGQNMCK